MTDRGGTRRCSPDGRRGAVLRPRAECATGRNLQVPSNEDRHQPAHVGPQHPDVGVRVVAPRTADVELERETAADPPTERRGGERVDGLREANGAQGRGQPHPQGVESDLQPAALRSLQVGQTG